MFTLLRGFFARKEKPTPPPVVIQPVSLTTTDATQGVSFADDIDHDLKRIHTKIVENPQDTLTVSEINILLERDLKLKPISSNFYNLNKEMANITVMEFSSINVLYDPVEHRVRSMDILFVDAVNATGAKLTMPAEAISELLVPISFTKEFIHANRPTT